jgi:FlaA1/EpsC-like NDP-sugar epimerase
MKETLINLPRKIKTKLILIFDLFAIIFSLFASIFIYFGYWHYPANDSNFWLVLLASPLIALIIFTSLGVYKDVIRFMGFQSIWCIFQGAFLHSILWTLIIYISKTEAIPFQVILINWLLIIVVITCSRLLFKWLLTEVSTNNNVLIYGAGEAGRQVSDILNGLMNYKPVGFIDDDDEILHHSINSLRVYSKDNLKDLIKSKDVKEIFIAIPSLSRFRRKEIIRDLEFYSVGVRSLPDVSEIAKGKVKVQDLLEVDVSELLGREPVKPNINLLNKNIFKKVVLVTGAGGSIGSELCQQILHIKPKKLILFEISESALYEIEQQLLNTNVMSIEIFPIIGSVRDKTRMAKICQHHGVQTIYHAAAYKHVPLVEYNQSQGVLNNTIGTLNAAQAAIESNVELFVLISTDKAVRPTNIMGASKRVSELVLEALNQLSQNTCFTIVRFGNVIGSSGSVIPLFKKQIKKGGPITVTHKDVVRFFMSIPEAVELVIQAGAMAKGGEVFLLDMGEPIRIYDLAVKMINLSGLQVFDKNNLEGDIEIIYSGLRPGEKLYEELMIGVNFSITENKFIMKTEEEMISWDKLEPLLAEIKDASISEETEKIYSLMKKVVPEFNSRNKNIEKF